MQELGQSPLPVGAGYVLLDVCSIEMYGRLYWIIAIESRFTIITIFNRERGSTFCDHDHDHQKSRINRDLNRDRKTRFTTLSVKRVHRTLSVVCTVKRVEFVGTTGGCGRFTAKRSVLCRTDRKVLPTPSQIEVPGRFHTS